MAHYSYKTSETLLGIETMDARERGYTAFCYKTSETLLGIETYYLKSRV
jgi:hypothetical protein